MKWQAVSLQTLRLRTWDDEFVVYNGLSGDTHLLDHAAGQILQTLCATPAEIDALTASLGALWDVDPDDEFRGQIERILADLLALALVEQR
jgi:PqqD family protein of HPr-rel-A system